MSLRDAWDWISCATFVVCFAVLMLVLMLTPFFDDWDDDAGKGE